MMRRAVFAFAALFLLIALWYGAWRWMVAGDVARVKATITYHNTRIKEINRATEIRTNGVVASGFPLHFRVRVEQPTLSYIWNDETYTASFDWVELTPRDSAQGSYDVTYSNVIHALYSKSGSAPELYIAVPDQPIGVILRAQGDSQQCSGFPGAVRCPDAAPDAPLISIALKLPPTISLAMTLGTTTKTALFTMPAVNIPIYQAIPADLQSPLELFVGVLREALIYQAP
ncbi:MAG: hypothetical protein B7X02_01765 [Rhodospirillales bacterium 12-54-5]|nr:MAG: hypothetical protein B7X02_01765 [Rhodospirillales bacterium 12-54-5]